jgi:hypothetical protein
LKHGSPIFRMFRKHVPLGRPGGGVEAPRSSEVLAFCKQYYKRTKLIKMEENLYILFDAVLRFTTLSVLSIECHCFCQLTLH